MARTKLSIYNRIFLKVGCGLISSLAEDAQQRVEMDAIWDDILDEVLEAKDWRFAKTRVTLAAGGEVDDVSGYTYLYAYQLPSDFLRLAKGTSQDPSIYPPSINHKIEVVTVTDILLGDHDVLALLTDYDNAGSDLAVNYIKRQSDYTLWTAHYTNAFCCRSAAELCSSRRENRARWTDLMEEYNVWATKAEALNMSLDYLKDEQGNNSWATAGR